MLKRTLFALVLVLVLTGPVLAAAYTSTQNGDWDDAATWGGGGTPGDNDTAVVDGHDVTVSANQSVEREANTTLNAGSLLIVANCLTQGGGTFTDNATSVIRVDGGGYFGCDQGSLIALSGSLVLNGGTLYMTAATDGFDCAKIITATAASPINFGGVACNIKGGFDAAGNQITVMEATASPALTVDVDGDLDLGTDGAGGDADWSGVDVDVSATAAALQADATVKSFTLSAGTLTGGGHTITVDGGGLARTGGNLNVAGAINVIFAATTGVAVWDSYLKGLGAVKVAELKEVTLSGNLHTKQLLNNGGTDGALALNTSKNLVIYHPTAQFWTWTGTITSAGTGGVQITINADCTNTASIEMTDTPLEVRGRGTSPDFNVLTVSGDVDIGTGKLTVRGAGGVEQGGLSIGGDLTCGIVAFGLSGQNRPGSLALSSSGDHAISGAVARADAGTAHVFNLAGCVTFGDDVTLAGIVPDFGSAVIEASGDLAIDGTTAGTITNTACCIFANGNTVTLDDIGYATTSAPIIAVSCTEGGTVCGAGVEFQEPQRMLMGCGF